VSFSRPVDVQMKPPPTVSAIDHQPISPVDLSPGCFSSIVTAAKLSALNPAGGAAAPPDMQAALTTVGPTYPAEVIMSQQMQLESLRNEVRELRMLVLRLGGQLPAPPVRTMTSSCVQRSLADDSNSKVVHDSVELAIEELPTSSELGDDPSEDDWSGSASTGSALLDASFSSQTVQQGLLIARPREGMHSDGYPIMCVAIYG